MWLWFARLGRECGYAHPDQYLDGLDAQQVTELLRLRGREPLESEKADVRAAMQSLVTARASGAGKDVKLDDVLIKWDVAAEADDEGPAQSEEELDAVFVRVAARIEASTKGGDE